MIKDLIAVKDRVAYLLSTYPELRDDDKMLWVAYLVTYHQLRAVIGEEAYGKFKTLLTNRDTPTMESIRRVRQKYQEEGQYVGTKRKRKLEEAERVRQWSLLET